MARHVKKGDTVMVTSGALRGQTGVIDRVDVKNDRVYLKGLNLQTKHVKRTQLTPQGSITTREAPIHISNVSPVVAGKPTRVRFPVNADGRKDRVAARTGEVIDKVRGSRNRAGAKAG